MNRLWPSSHTRSRFLTGASLAAVISIVHSTAVSQEAHVLSRGNPADVGMSAAVLEGAAGIYREAVQRGELVGAVILVARHGKVVMHEAIGLRDREQQLPMEPGTLFRMASNTKPVVATAIAQLVENGELSYTDLVRQHLPGWDNYRAGFVNVGHLLSHSSGLRIPTLFLSPLGDDPTLQGESDRFGGIGATVPPGTSYSYNNPGYNTLGALVEMASGNLLEAQLRAVIYDPLGMEDSYNHQAGHELGGKLERMGAVYYQRGEDGEWQAGGTPGGPVAFPFARASGGMVSTAWDYAIFCQMFLNGGVYDGQRIISPESAALMTTPKIQISGEGDDADYYGYGWRVQGAGYGHGGSDGTNAWLDPGLGVIALAFTQTPRGQPSFERFRELVIMAVEDSP